MQEQTFKSMMANATQAGLSARGKRSLARMLLAAIKHLAECLLRQRSEDRTVMPSTKVLERL